MIDEKRKPNAKNRKSVNPKEHQNRKIKAFTGLKPQNWKSPKQLVSPIDQFRYIEIQPDTIDLNTKLWEINPTNSVVIP